MVAPSMQAKTTIHQTGELNPDKITPSGTTFNIIKAVAAMIEERYSGIGRVIHKDTAHKKINRELFPAGVIPVQANVLRYISTTVIAKVDPHFNILMSLLY